MSNHTILSSIRNTVEQVQDLALSQGVTILNPGSVRVDSMTDLIRACKEKKPMHVNGWLGDNGDYNIASTWSFDDTGPKFITIYAKSN